MNNMDGDNENTCLLENRNSKSTIEIQRSKWTPIEIYFTLYMIAYNFNSVILQYFTIAVVATSYNQTDFINRGSSNCNNFNHTKKDNIQEESSEILTNLGFCSTFMTVFSLIILGGLSDKTGRKFVLVSCLIGMLIKELIYILAIYLKLSMFIWYFAQTIDGLAGGSGGVVMIAFAMTADITTPGKERAFRLIIVQGVGTTMSALSFVAVGYWISFAGFIIPMAFSIAVTSFNILFCIFFISETSTIQSQVERCKLTHVLKSFKLYIHRNPSGRRVTLSLALLLLAISSLGMLGKSNVQVLFLLNDPLCWNEVHIQVYNSVLTIAYWVVTICILRVLQSFIPDYGLVSIGTLSAAVSLLCFAFATKDWLVYIYSALGILSSFMFPVLRAMMSRQCTPEEQGSLFTSVTTVEVLFAAISSIICGELYKQSVSFFPGLVFIALGCLSVLAFLISLILYRLMSKNRPATLRVQ